MIADIYRDLRSTTSKLEKTASSIAFIEHALHHHVTPKFATVKGNFLQTEDKIKAERSLLFSHLRRHKKSICSLSKQYDEQVEILKNNVGELLSKLILIRLRNSLRYSNIQQLSTKNKKLFQLKKSKTTTFDVPFTSATVPVINLCGYNLNVKGLKYGLHHCFIDKSRLA